MKYEYLPVTSDAALQQADLDQRANQGWELLSMAWGGRPERWYYVFRRPKTLKLKGVA